MARQPAGDGIAEALEVSEVVYEMRVQRLMHGTPKMTRRQAIDLLNAEDAARPMDGPGKPSTRTFSAPA